MAKILSSAALLQNLHHRERRGTQGKPVTRDTLRSLRLNYEPSSFWKVALTSSLGFFFSSPSISRSRGGFCGAVRSNSMVCFQSIDPLPGQRCESLSLLLSCTWVEQMWFFS